MLKIAFDKSYKHPLGKNHRFPMIKYELIPEQLLRKNICFENSFFAPDEILKANAILRMVTTMVWNKEGVSRLSH